MRKILQEAGADSGEDLSTRPSALYIRCLIHAVETVPVPRIEHELSRTNERRCVAC